MAIMDFYEGHLCKSAPRSAADFGWEAHGIQSKFRGNLNLALKCAWLINSGKSHRDHLVSEGRIFICYLQLYRSHLQHSSLKLK